MIEEEIYPLVLLRHAFRILLVEGSSRSVEVGQGCWSVNIRFKVLIKEITVCVTILNCHESMKAGTN